MGRKTRKSTAANTKRRGRAWWGTVLVVVLLAGGGLGAWAFGLLGEKSAEERLGPNVLVLVMDTTRGDRVSVAGYDRPTTPRLAAFAEDAVVYRNAYVPAGWTGPAHASLFTGLRPENHGFLTGNRYHLTDVCVTLAELLSTAGWSAQGWSSNNIVSPDFGLAQGFSRFEMVPEPSTPKGKVAGRVHRRALEEMKNARARGVPFFVFINDIEPHTPYAPPERFERRFVSPEVSPGVVGRERRFDHARGLRYLVDPSQIPPDRMRIRSDLYDAEIASLDAAIGDLLDGMRAAGLLDDTIVVITSDHGEHFGERGRVEHIFSLYRPILHVPLVVRAPGHLDGGVVVDDVVRLEDVFPTILELCGLEAPVAVDGESLLHLDPSQPRIARASYGRQDAERLRSLVSGVPFEDFAFEIRSVVEGRWHLVRREDGREELFDVEADPLEATDLSVSRPEVRDRLRPLLPPWSDGTPGQRGR